MIDSDPQSALKGWRAIRPPYTFGLLAVGLLAALSLGAELIFQSVAAPFALFVLIAILGLRGLAVDYPHRSLGLCNGVTLLRAALVAVLAAAIVEPDVSRWFIFAIACVAFAMDGLDGWLARRAGLTSAFGARFDMEIDALLGAVLSLIAWRSGIAGPEILILGFARYAFVAVSALVPKLRASLPESLRRKTICVIQIATLIAILCPVMPQALIVPATLFASGLLLWSFAVDTRRLLQTA